MNTFIGYILLMTLMFSLSAGLYFALRTVRLIQSLNIFYARIDFSLEGGLRIAEIESVNNIEPSKTSDFYTQDELEPLLYKMRTAKQKQLLSSHFLDLKKTYMVEGKTAFNKKFNSINGLGRSTIILLLSSFKEGYFILLFSLLMG